MENTYYTTLCIMGNYILLLHIDNIGKYLL